MTCDGCVGMNLYACADVLIVVPDVICDSFAGIICDGCAGMTCNGCPSMNCDCRAAMIYGGCVVRPVMVVMV
jgi:hypothetical protein